MSLSAQQIQEFRTNGILIAPNILTSADFQPVIDEVSGFIDRRARELKQQGKLTHLYEDRPFDSRIGCLYDQCEEIIDGIDIMSMRGRAVFDFLHNKNLLDAVECLIGPEITCSPIQHLRPKMPGRYGQGQHQLVPWHQDSGVTLEEAENSDIVTCWIPMVPATRENGCMEVIPGVTHYFEHVSIRGTGTTIRPDLVPTAKPICAECPLGGIVFMNKLTPHRGLPNLTDQVRWTIDLRYQKTGTPTGRSFQPDFPVRSANASSIRYDYPEWCRRWIQGLEDSAGKEIHRIAAVVEG